MQLVLKRLIQGPLCQWALVKPPGFYLNGSCHRISSGQRTRDRAAEFRPSLPWRTQASNRRQQQDGSRPFLMASDELGELVAISPRQRLLM